MREGDRETVRHREGEREKAEMGSSPGPVTWTPEVTPSRTKGQIGHNADGHFVFK